MDKLSKEQQNAVNYFKSNCMSVEVLKEDNLQTITFRVFNKNIVREEVKEVVKWGIDRSSPSNRIRDFMCWSKEVLDDAQNQRKILSNKCALFLTNRWLWWNYAAIFISLIINILMLITWDAPLALENVPSNVTVLPEEIYNPVPVVLYEKYFIPVTFGLGGLHNCAALLVLITYFISNHPKLPSPGKCLTPLFCCRKTKPAPSRLVYKSRLDTHLISWKTFYYLLFFGLSVAGTGFTSYLFAFHLLHIVSTNQLLQGVVKALTKNGKSLLWVAILGIVIFYLYSLIAFAFMRGLFNPEERFYCETLWQCTVTVIRYGLIGDLGKSLHDDENFMIFGLLAIYKVSFFIFITTIGLNVIFGIIVDTFSEHREKKWAAERDMQSSCFICGRASFEFEHHAQGGFNRHVMKEHNMWAYIFYFLHLDDTKPNDYTALDLFVATSLKKDSYDFFPVNCARSLEAAEDDNAEVKIDHLMDLILTLVKNQREKESERKITEERIHQMKWQEKYKRPPQPMVDHISFGHQEPLAVD